MKQFIVSLICLLVVPSGYAAGKKTHAGKTHPPECTVTGYLVDINSAKKILAEGDHSAIKAKTHERAVCLQPENIASGFGVFVIVPMTNTMASDVDFYTFNAAGNKMALDMLEKTTDKDNLLVKVNGKAMLSAQSLSWLK